MTTSLQHKSAQSRGLSGGVFQKIPVKAWAAGLASGSREGVYQYDDFFILDTARWSELEPTRVTTAHEEELVEGAVSITQAKDSSADGDEGAISAKDASNVHRVNFSSGKLTACEIRLKVDQVANGNRDYAFGLMKGTTDIAVDALIDDDDALEAIDFVGFFIGDNAGTRLDAVYKEASGSMATVKESAHTLVADTYVNLGIFSDGTNCEFFVDGQKVGDSVDISLAAFPADSVLKPVVAMKLPGAVSTADVKVLVDFIATAQQL